MPCPRITEFSEAIQHPERSSEHYDENVDNLSSLAIYLSQLPTHLITDFLDHHGTGSYGHAVPHTVRNINDHRRQWTRERTAAIGSLRYFPRD